MSVSSFISHLGPPAKRLLAELEREARAPDCYLHRLEAILDLKSIRPILALGPAARGEMVLAIVVRLRELWQTELARPPQAFDPDSGPDPEFMADFHSTAALNYTIALLLAKPGLSVQQLVPIAEYWAEVGSRSFYLEPPFELYLDQLDRLQDGRLAEAPLRAALAGLSDVLNDLVPPARRKRLRNRIGWLISGVAKVAPDLGPGEWRDLVRTEISKLPARQTRSATDAVQLALDAVGKSKPTTGYLARARALAGKDPDLLDHLFDWVEKAPTYQGSANSDAVRGLLWIIGCGDAGRYAERVARHCRKCWKKGSRAEKAGSGALQALALLGGPHAIAALVGMRKTIRYAAAQARIETALAQLAADMGIGREELEEIGVPTFELSPDGERRMAIGGGTAVLRVSGNRDVTLAWIRDDGRTAASPTAAMKAADPSGIKDARRLRKEIQVALQGQRMRFEELYLTGRQVPFRRWCESYRDHPLLAPMVRHLVWNFTMAETSVTGLPRAGAIEDASGQVMSPGPATTVSLWHPLHSRLDHALAWRRRLETLGVTQPFKQAHREIYTLTEAERATGLHTNRFAGHLLRQHRFKSLCDQRGWHFALMGDWDSHNTPTRNLDRVNLNVEYWVDVAESEPPLPSGIYPIIKTDRVLFRHGRGEPVALGDLPPILFSEVMRDLDLFVSVASIGYDADWTDGAWAQRFEAYLSNHSLAELNGLAAARREVLLSLLPRLSISDRCSVDDRHLIVRGKLRTYKIHIGSSNVMVEPDGTYLCILPSTGKASKLEEVSLPFEGDDTLSVILSKAFLLADDDRIRDQSIVSQIGRA